LVVRARRPSTKRLLALRRKSCPVGGKTKMLDMVDISEFSRHQAWWTVRWCGCRALGANCVCRFVVAGENGVRACPKSGQKILSDCVISCVGVLVVATGVAMREPGRLTKVSGRGASKVC
jgi:hypothetical protein